MNALQFLISLRPAIPMSAERPGTQTSNSELRRWMANGAVIFNGNKLRAEDEIECECKSLVFFPKSELRKTTLY